MKKIHLLRHAKSCWNTVGLDDQLRPLSARGHNDCLIMADAMFDSGFEFPPVYCSMAKRAQLTIQNISQQWQGRPFNWSVDGELYTFSASSLTKWLREKFVECDELMVVGHNPAMYDLINQYCEFPQHNFPTCAYAQLNVSSWSESHGALVQFLTPKMFK